MKNSRPLLQILLVLAIAVLIGGCSTKTKEDAAKPSVAASTVVEPAVEQVPPCQIVIPGADLSIPKWAGQRDDEPFDVRKYLEDWQQKHTDAECYYLRAMADFWPDIAALSNDVIQKQQVASANRTSQQIFKLCPGYDPPNGPWDDVLADELSQRLQSTYLMIDKAQDFSDCVFSSKLDFRQKIPHIEAARHFMKIGAIELRRSRKTGHQGPFEESEKVLQRMLRLSRDIRPRGTSIQQIVASTIERMALSAITADILNHPTVTAEQCQRLTELLHYHETRVINQLVEAASAEYVMNGNALDGLQKEVISFEDVNLPAVSRNVYGLINYDIEWKALNSIYAFVLDEYFPQHYSEVILHDRYQESVKEMALRADIDDHLPVKPNQKLPFSFIVPTLLPALSQLREVAARGQVRFGGIKSLLLIRRFELQHQRLPATLEEAFQDAGIGPVPDDPYSGDKLKYRVADDTVKVYSVGSDQQDDQAEADWKFGQQPGDFILSMPVWNS